MHDAVIEHYGGRLGFPHPGYLDSALNAPRQQLHYDGGGCDLYDLAAAYLFHVAKAHAFTDGNKRTAYLSALYFLHLNGRDLTLPSNRLLLARATEAAAKDELSKPQIAAIMRQMPAHGRPQRRRGGGSVGRKSGAANRKKRVGRRSSKKKYF